ncbi:MAG TPA: 16S rRNA (adenine(1518)-N(6)/adenine(1519)-N(6))-dimethyltransferase RsmA [Polyangiaceae bacterium]|jgi:16S rRNA (adenine1518-N6/adenine1519-N6)-dimethyltransferase
MLSPKALLSQHGLRAKRSFGQNFLVDQALARKIAAFVCPEQGGGLVEIGAGLGALTGPLLDRGARVTAIERDRDLVPLLRQQFPEPIGSGVLRLVEADAQTVDYEALLADLPRPRRLCGNLPYQLSGPLLRRVAALGTQHIEGAVFLLQLEVVNRLLAPPGSGDYGAMSVFIQARFEARRRLVISRRAFYPVPRVDSALVELTMLPVALSQETPAFRAVVKAAFLQRRKKLRNAWRGLLDRSDEQIARAALRAKIDLDARGETLDVTAFARMAEEVRR